MILRIWSEYWPYDWLEWSNEDYKNPSNYYFYKYLAQVRTSKREGWGKELEGMSIRMMPFPPNSPHAVASKITSMLSLESIVRQVLGKSYAKMMHPSYDILLWEGPHPITKLKKKNIPEIITRTPEGYVRDKLSKRFDEYYQFKNLISQNQHEKAYNMISKNRLGYDFIDSIDNNFLENFT